MKGEAVSVFDADELRVGDVIAYPAVLRREHGTSRSELRIVRIEGRFIRVHRTSEEASPEPYEYSVFPNQLAENGVLLLARSEAANSHPRGDEQ